MLTNSELDDWAMSLLDAWNSHTPKPVVSLAHAKQADAYEVQAKFATLRGAAISGFKGGLSNKAAQESQKTDSPLGGILLADVAHAAVEPLHLENFLLPAVETEIGFVVAKDITSKLSLPEFIESLECWRPMIEIVDLGFASRPALNDLIAGNVAAAHYISSDYQHPVSTVNEAQVSLTLDGEHLHTGKASDALGDQLIAARWLADHIVDRGFPIRKGYILMTGSLGAIQLAKKGKYSADYGPFGVIDFSFE